MLQTANQKLTKRERRNLRKQGVTIQSGLSIKQCYPLTINQGRAFKEYENGKDIFLHGTAGTGKTFLAMYFALKDVLSENYEKLIIVRSAVQARQIGHLPGNPKEKLAAYEAPYYYTCSKLFNKEYAYDFLKDNGKIEFVSTSFNRGMTFDNAVVIVEECQNFNWSELSTTLTRLGKNCRVIVCGDTKQSDLHEMHGKKDLLKLIQVCKNLSRFAFVQMGIPDIVRSGFVKDFIIECEELGY